MTRLLRIGDDNARPLIEVPSQKSNVDVPLADYEADLLLKVAKK
jgi:hypothetical protein